MPTFSQEKTHTFPQPPSFRWPPPPPPPTFGEDRFEIPIAPDGRVIRAWLDILDGDPSSHAEATLPEKGAMGPQTVTVRWAVAPVPGSTVRYRLNVEHDLIPTGVGRVLLFEHANYEGQVLDVRNSINFNSLSAAGLNDRVSSLVVLSGAWVFYRDDMKNPYSSYGRAICLNQGMYPWVGDIGIVNDDMSSLRAIAQ